MLIINYNSDDIFKESLDVLILYVFRIFIPQKLAIW